MISIFSREGSLNLVSKTLSKLNAPAELIILATRKNKLMPSPPPGAKSIVISRNEKIENI